MRDYVQALEHHRADNAANETVDVDDSGRRELDGGPGEVNGLFLVEGATGVEFRFFATGDDNQQCQVTVVGWPAGTTGAGKKEGSGSKGARLVNALITFGTSTTVNKHPITGKDVSSTTFREADTIDTTSGPGTEYTGVTKYDAAAGNGQARLIVDPQNMSRVYVFIHNRGGSVGNIEVSARRL